MPEPMMITPQGQLTGRNWLRITGWMPMGRYISGPAHRGFTTFQWLRHERLTIQQLQNQINGHVAIWDGKRIQSVELVNRNDLFALFAHCLPPLASVHAIRRQSYQPATRWLLPDRRIKMVDDVHSTFVWLLTQEAITLARGDTRLCTIVRRADGRLALFRT